MRPVHHSCVSLLQALAADPHEEGLQEVVRNVFGFPGFRGHQLPVVQAVLQGRSTLAIMPTGVKHKPCLQLLQWQHAFGPGVSLKALEPRQCLTCICVRQACSCLVSNSRHLTAQALASRCATSWRPWWAAARCWWCRRCWR